MAGHLRKILILFVNALFNHNLVFRVIGAINRRWNFLRSVFVMYPATKDYTSAYLYKRHWHALKWSPWIGGVFRQNGKWGLILGITGTDDDFRNTDNSGNLQALAGRAEHVRRLIGATQKTFAGILPGILFKNRFVRETVEMDVAVEAIVRAEGHVRTIERHGKNTPLIVLGGNGFVGRRLIKRLNGREVYCVDSTNGKANTASWPGHLKESCAILINISKSYALSDYTSLFWPGLVVLNEVYPEPHKEELEMIKAKGCAVYHIVGIEGKAYPSFPNAYTGGIPCCAARISEDMRVIVKRLI
ncbi:MAG: hypothetical protein E3K37_03360 [Candidatus Kuenenia sp.]|nr:hypothetical protein [Candidatus Kuenenia hertensis]